MSDTHDEKEKNGEEKRSERIARLEENLYSRRPNLIFRSPRRLASLPKDVRNEWKHTTEENVTPLAYRGERKSKRYSARIFLLLSFAFFLAAAAVSVYLFFIGGHIISSDNIDIAISGPTTVSGGADLALQIAIRNDNSTDLLLSNLLIEYPPGTRAAPDATKELPRLQESLGMIAQGESIKRAARAILYGEEGSTQVIHVTLEYRVEGSNAILSKEKNYEVLLGSAPTGLAVHSIKKANSGQDMEFTVDIVSNAGVITKDVLLVAEYPFGFTFKSAEPKPTSGVNVWRIGDLPPEGKRKIKITGTITGQDGDERVFRFATGIQGDANEQTIRTPLALALQSVLIERPFLGVNFSVDGTVADEHVEPTGKAIRVDVEWRNNLLTLVENAEIEVRLRGDAIDKNSVSVSNGFYRSVDNTIRWDGQTTEGLRSIRPNESGNVGFNFATYKKGTPLMDGLRSPEITLEVTVRGQRVSETQVPERIESTVATRILVNTDPTVTARLTHATGPFINSGPLPPRTDKETTYTAVWSLTNSTNEIGNAMVSATLPTYVRWMNVVEPSSESVLFREVGGIIVWNVGTLKEGTGEKEMPREVSFQVALTPSVSQIGREIEIIGLLDFSGEDRFTGAQLHTSTGRGVTTRLSTEPGFKQGDSLVVP